jgi:hypothetical protein
MGVSSSNGSGNGNGNGNGNSSSTSTTPSSGPRRATAPTAPLLGLGVLTAGSTEAPPVVYEAADGERDPAFDDSDEDEDDDDEEGGPCWPLPYNSRL